MSANFPEVWLDRVIKNLTNENIAPWLDGIPEMDVDILESGKGTASEINAIHIPRALFKPEVLINNTTYPLALQSYDDDEVIVKLDKYQTKPTQITDDQIIGASYDKIDVVTKGHTIEISSAKYKKAIHAIAPAADSGDTPVIQTSGDEDANGRKRLVYDDLVSLKDKLDAAGTPADNRRLVLCTDHWNDMLLDRKNFGDQLVNYKQGDLAPYIAGFQIFQYVANPIYAAAGAKKPYGSIKAATDTTASIAFYKSNIAKKTGLTKQYFSKASEDPESQSNKLNYRHYFIALPAELKYIAAIR